MDEWTDLDEAYLDIFGEHPDVPAAAAPALQRIVAARHAISDLKAEMSAAVADARSADATWGQVGKALGCSKQSAYQRYGRHPGLPPRTR